MSVIPWDWIKVDAMMRRKFLSGASSSARDVADYAEEVLQAARKTGRTVKLDKAQMMKELGLSERSVERAIRELIERKALVKHDGRGCYTFDLTYARAGMNRAERDDERDRQRNAEQRESTQMQTATILKFKSKQAEDDGERMEVIAA